MSTPEHRDDETADEAAFTHRIAWSDLKTGHQQIRIIPDAGARARMAKLLGLLGVGEVVADMALDFDFDANELILQGSLRARVRQRCCVTLKPFEQAVEAMFSRRYNPKVIDEWGAFTPNQQAAEMVLGPEDPDPPDPVVDGGIDLGQVLCEELALAVDPYPRADGAVLEAGAAGTAADDLGKNPFAALARLRKPKDSA